jgi:hypothetical protein
MNKLEFDKIVAARLDAIEQTLSNKGKEYSTEKDKLHNFNVAAQMNNQTREKALWGMATKHLVSVKDMIDNTELNKFPSNEICNEKIGDLINYLVLLEACFKDRNQPNEKTVRPF